MAVWQWEARLIPRASVPQRVLAMLPAALNKEEMPTRFDFGGSATLAGIKRRISEVLPPLPSWSDEIIIWGTEDGHRVEIVLATANVEEIWIRVDVRSEYSSFVRRILRLASQVELLLLTHDDQVLSPDNEGSVLRHIGCSPAFEFSRDPHRYLRKIGASMENDNCSNDTSIEPGQ